MARIEPLLSEEDIRAFNMCPAFFQFGGKTQWPDNTALLKLATEKAISYSLRDNRLDHQLHYMNALIRSIKELKLNDRLIDGQVGELQNKVGLALGELFSSFAANTFLPVFGPTPLNVKISKTVIQLTVSGILRSTKNQTLHLIDFTPYKNVHGIKNDPILFLKTKSFMQFVRPFRDRSQCILHVFAMSDNHTLIYNQIDSQSVSPIALNRVNNLIQAIESGTDFPVLPCNRSCKFKSKCYLELE